MTTITHKETYKIQRAFFYGCSNTAGTELVDADLLGISFQETNKIKNKHQKNPTVFYTDLYSRLQGEDKSSKYYDEMCKQHSYAKHLCDLLKVEYFNFSEPGSSNKRILFNIMTHVTEGRFKKGDVVFVGVTSPLRDMLFDEDGNITNFLFGHKNSLNERQEHYESLLLMNTDYQIALNNIIILQAIESLLFRENIPCVLIETHPYCEHSNEKYSDFEIKTLETHNLQQIYRYTINRINFAPVGSPYKYEGERCGFGHPTLEHHRMFANELYQYLRRNND